MRLLVVEDDPVLGDGLRAGLRQAAFAVDLVTDGLAAERALSSEPYDLAIIDLGLPRMSGTHVLASLRLKGNTIPVLILTARDSIIDRVEALDGGADDYLTKPFELDELCARVRALLRRSAGRAMPVLQHGDLVLDPAAQRVTYRGKYVDLSSREIRLLEILLSNSGRVMSRSRLEQSLYGWGEEVGSNAIEVHVHHLRRKLGKGLIKTIRGIGYFVDPVVPR